jgi:hypothetical protein
MTTQADFTPEEWTQVLEGPPSAGVLVITASRGGTFRETFSIGKAYAEARQRHGQSELLDAIVAAKPKTDHARYHSPEELKEHALQHIRDAVALLQAKATPQELEDYRGFIRGLAERVAEAHSEHGEQVSQGERAAIGEIEAALGSGGAPASSAAG